VADKTKPIANPELILREEFDDWAVLFDPDSGDGFGLSPTSVFIWKLLDGKHTEESILEQLRHHFDDVPEEADAHVREFVQSLVSHGFAGYEVETL
jgi:SynChlorMet cassette protein ScmD